MTVPKARPIQSSKHGTILTPNFHTNHTINPKIEEDPRVFNNLYHETEIHTPIHTGLTLTPPETIVKDCLDMPIRLKNSKTYSIPEDWKQYNPIFQQLIDMEAAHNPNWEEYYTYLTVHYTPNLAPGEQQRHAGCHTDGFQGIREPIRTKTSRSYVAVTNGGTRYFPQTFVANLDAGKFNIFQGFDLQVQKNEQNQPKYEIADENTFYYFNAYTVHESGEAVRNDARLFIRLTWEMKLFDRAGNTKNNMLNYNWPPVTYDVRQNLQTPTLKDIENAKLT